MTGAAGFPDDGDEPLRRAIARTLGDLRRRDRAAEEFVLADPDEDAVHVIEFGRADRPAHVETIDAGDVGSAPGDRDGEGTDGDRGGP